MTTVGIVGVGLLGDAVASRLRAAGHAVVGYDVVTASMDRLAALGGTPAKSAGDVARAADVGRAGQAMVLKLVANLLVALNSAAAAEAINLARANGLDPQIVVDVLATGAATSRMLEVRGPLMVRGEFPAQMKLDLFMKDLHLIQDAAKTAGASLPLTDIAERLYAAAQAAGHGADDLAVVITELERSGKEEKSPA